MTSPLLAPLQIEDLNLDDHPEVALLVSRRAIEVRLDWLMSYLAPNERTPGAKSSLDILKSRSEFDAKTVRAILDVLTATNPVAHGRSVSPSVAAVVAESAARVSAALDQVIASVQLQLQGMPARKRLAYAFLALPTARRRSIAKRLDLLGEDADSLSRKDSARAIFERASNGQMLTNLWIATAEETSDISRQPPLGLE